MKKALSIAVGLLIVAVAPGFAAAAEGQPSTVERIIAQEQAKGGVSSKDANERQAQPTSVQRIVAQERGRHADPQVWARPPSSTGPLLIVKQPGTFQWGDAGVGAAGALALALLAAGGIALVREGRGRQIRA